MENLNEKCAVFGIFNAPGVASNQAYFGLFALQHRGQEQSGIVSTDGKKFLCVDYSLEADGQLLLRTAKFEKSNVPAGWDSKLYPNP